MVVRGGRLEIDRQSDLKNSEEWMDPDRRRCDLGGGKCPSNSDPTSLQRGPCSQLTTDRAGGPEGIPLSN